MLNKMAFEVTLPVVHVVVPFGGRRWTAAGSRDAEPEKSEWAFTSPVSVAWA